ncbi:glycosyltransferase LafB, responsible for the formation of Gal-Glc-DAG [Lachnospiraceae bacterium KM106-2]|nr:glycosyltransferase LafB, responsible for the formation of Gal-Glc-DAG [Lachnospiraceae bacterium KM106-2]
MKKITMLSRADSVEGQGVGSAYLEQLALVREELSSHFSVRVNSLHLGDITHYHTINPEFFLTIPFAKMKGTAVGYVHFLPETLEESIHLPKWMKKIFYWYVMKFYRSMDLLVTVNPCFIERLAAYNINKEKVTYIPNYVSDKEFYRISDTSKEDLRKKYHLDPNRFTVLTVGQLQIRKGIMDFIKVAKEMPEIQFVWAGDFSFGKISDGYEDIKKIKENPPENVTFLGIIPRSQMNEIYNLADVMFLPSYNELFPMTILESMNCKVPILLRDLDLYPDILFDFYLKGNSNEDFIKEIKQLSNDPSFYDHASALSDKGRCFYSREHIAQMWDEFYTNACMCKKKKVKSDNPQRVALDKDHTR